MKITLKNSVKKFQTGGSLETPQEMPQEAPMNEGAPAPEEAPQGGEQDPLVILAQMSAQALQNQDCQMAMQVCQAFMQIAQQMTAPEPQGEPVFARNGCKLVRRIKK